ncbi:hypothetical protein [Limobrevibacterium gyesilva]|uniref:Uncharacterized protein n=1 Tax=Limobrevibacterium gyesilva TaxID=2991712 RepID=A0AA42CDF1_9PROT|nr:hypothetical protein [Limobrevibacterium gyesilva]MCW3474783.1 hypothetical protein [Limobrevibacterium gyesilva]
MANEPAGGSGGGPKAPKDLPQHPLVEQLKPDPSQPARRVVALSGLPGNSDRAGYQRLYLTTKLDYYAEFLATDILLTEAVPADESPFPGVEATRVTIGRDATIHYIWAKTAQPVDEFDLDVRLGAAGAAAGAIPIPLPTRTCPDGTVCGTCDGTCDTCGRTCVTCETCFTRCGQATCATCETRCNQATCAATCQTCATQCNQATCAGTCNTCATQCNQATCAGTCNTCATQCNQATCHTCHTRCGGATCVTCHTCIDTCHRTCVTCCGHPFTCV